MVIILVTIFLKERKKKQKEKIERFFKSFEKKYGFQQSGSCRKNEIDLCEKVENLLIEKEK